MAKQRKYRLMLITAGKWELSIVALLRGRADETEAELKNLWYADVCSGAFPLPRNWSIEEPSDLKFNAEAAAESFAAWLVTKRGFKRVKYEDVWFE